MSDLTRARVLDVLARRDAARLIAARYRESLAHDGRSGYGRARYGLGEALRALGVSPGLIDSDDAFEWSVYGDDYVGGVTTAIDAVHLVVETRPDDDDAPDCAPVRIVVEDGGDGSHAGGYLALDEAYAVRALLDQAITRAERAAALEPTT